MGLSWMLEFVGGLRMFWGDRIGDDVVFYRCLDVCFLVHLPLCISVTVISEK